jgi:hypothetical protein
VRVHVDGSTYEFEQNGFSNKDFIAIERELGMTAIEWRDGLNKSSMLAITGLIWILRRRDEDPALRFDDVEFNPDTLDMEEDEDSGKDPTEAELVEASAFLSVSTAAPVPSPSDTTPTSSDSLPAGDFGPGNSID